MAHETVAENCDHVAGFEVSVWEARYGGPAGETHANKRVGVHGVWCVGCLGETRAASGGCRDDGTIILNPFRTRPFSVHNSLRTFQYALIEIGGR